MAIIVFSPFSGRPVKVRDQDVGRAVRDEAGRIFYVLPKSDGSGHYGAPTRAGGPKDEARAREYEAKVDQAESFARQQLAAHDATGRKRSSARGKLVILGLAIIVAIMVYLFGFGPLSHRQLPWQNPPAPPTSQVTAPGGLNHVILREGAGPAAAVGDRVSVHYTGVLHPSGQKFDSSHDRGEPFTFTLGRGQVIKGWDQGVVGMKVGELRELIIPPNLAYGNRALPGIPPGSTLRFEVELIAIE